MVHESLKRVAQLLQLPLEALQVTPFFFRERDISSSTIDPNRILETDLLRWLYLKSSDRSIVELVQKNLSVEDLQVPICRKFFSFFFQEENLTFSGDLLSLAIQCNDAEIQDFFNELLEKRVNLIRAKEGIAEIIEKILVRNWMKKREEVKRSIESTEEEKEKLTLLQEYDFLTKTPPKLVV